MPMKVSESQASSFLKRNFGSKVSIEFLEQMKILDYFKWES